MTPDKTIYLNSRARKLPFGARLRGAAFESCLPLALISVYAAGYMTGAGLVNFFEWIAK
jgi:hypothetical protein